MTNSLRVFATVAVAALVGATLGIAGWEVFDDDAEPAPAVATPDSSPQPASVSSSGSSVAAIYRRVGGAVVLVRAETGGGVATGSGFVIDDQGRVVTNQHVVGSATDVTVVSAAGDEYDAEVVGTDPSTDIALLDVEDGAELPVLALGSAESLSVGDPVIAIGSPFGLQGTVTSGIVSGLDREIQAPDGRFVIDGAIQTDAALNSGNSGGPLLDDRGRVVGVNSQIESSTGGNVGVGYAVPVETVKNVVEQLLADGSAEHGYLGVQLGDPGDEEGVPVAEVVAGGPAADGGLRAGDRILRVAGDEVDAVADVRTAVGDRKPGDRVQLEVRRGGDTTTVTVVLGDRADAATTG
jgi:putative serine protease PepD